MNAVRLLLLMAIAVLCVIILNPISAQLAEKSFKYIEAIPLKEPIQLTVTFLIFRGLLKFLAIHNDNKMPLGTIESICLSVVLTIFLVGASFAILAAIGLIERANVQNFGTFEVMVGSVFMIMHGASEQLIAQGIVHAYARQFWGRFIGIGAAALCFAIAQFLQGYDAPILIFNSLILGAFFSIIAMRFGLMAAIFAHGTWTWFEVLVLGQVFGLKLKQIPPLFIDSDSYGTIVLTFVGTLLCFLLLFFKQNRYKTAHDEAKHQSD